MTRKEKQGWAGKRVSWRTDNGAGTGVVKEAKIKRLLIKDDVDGSLVSVPAHCVTPEKTEGEEGRERTAAKARCKRKTVSEGTKENPNKNKKGVQTTTTTATQPVLDHPLAGWMQGGLEEFLKKVEANKCGCQSPIPDPNSQLKIMRMCLTCQKVIVS